MADEPVRTPVLALLRAFTWPEVRRQPWRHATAVLAVLLGVALAFSVHLINASALSEFSAAVRSVQGQPDLTVQPAQAQGLLDDAVFGQVARHPQVAWASAVIDTQVQAQAEAAPDAGARASPATTRLRLIGLDPLNAAPMAPELVPRLDKAATHGDGRALFSPQSISLNASAQAALGVPMGGLLSLAPPAAQATAGQPRPRVTLRVIGRIAAGHTPTAVMDIAGAQQHLGLLGRVHRIDVQLVPGAQAQAVAQALALPPGVVVSTAEASAQRLSNLSRAYRVNLTVLSLVALFTGAFLVFSVLSLSVSRRLPHLALLGVLGLSAGERLRLVLWESLAIGLLGAVLGLALGTGLAMLALQQLSGDLGGGYFPGIAPTLQWSPAGAMVYGALGAAAAVLGGWLPARRAGRLVPAQALKGQGEAEPAPRPGWRAWALGPGLLLGGSALALLPPVQGVPLWAYVSVACLLLGGLACVPLGVSLTLSRWPQPRSAPGLLAMERARRMPHTATVAVAGVVASLSLSVALTVMVSSFRSAVSQWLDVVLPADLYARATHGQDGQGEGSSVARPTFDRAWLPHLAQVPGVARVQGLRLTSLVLDARQAPVDLIARPLSQPARELPTTGTVLPDLPGEVNVHVSEAMVALHGARPGGTLALPLVAGQPPVRVQVRSVWRDYARQGGAIVISDTDHQRLTGDKRLNDLAIWLQPEASPGEVQTRLRARLAQLGLQPEQVTFAEPGQIRALTLQIFDRSFAVTYWLQAVAIGIGLFGTAASFSAQVLARRKEFGLLVHLGFTRRQVLATVAGEGAAFTGVGALLGLGLGLAVSVVLVHVVNPQSFHWTMELQLPGWRLLALAASVVLAGTGTAWLAGRAATGQDVVTAVKEDW